ncbi:MAG: hypothetical protein JXR36_07305 [Bacteroidales bacterium]|nr:hypothetical protein [Bacteroidales bacterium]
MKKVLIIAYDFPPYVSVGGLRPFSWYKYFKEFGLYPIVITRQWGNKYGTQLDYIAPSETNETIVEETEFGTIIRTPYKPNLSNRIILKYGENKFRFLRKLVTAYYEFMQFLFFVGPKAGIYRGAKKYIKKQKVDIIIATGEPFVLFKYAAKLSSKFNVHWIADYRDPWTQDKSRGNNPVRIFKDKLLERQFLANASGVSTVSVFFLSQIRQNVETRTNLICPNGFDEENISAVQNISQGNEILSIGFVGTVYNWHPLEIFLKVVSEFVTINPDKNIHIYLYGTNLSQDDFDNLLEKFSALQNHFFKIPRMPNEELLRSLAERNLLLLFNYYSYMGTKIYDYLGLKRKILFCFSEDEESEKLKAKYFNITSKTPVNEKLQEELLLETNSGIIVKNSAHLFRVLDDLYTEFETSKKIDCFSNGIEEYSRRNQAKKLADLIKSVVEEEEKKGYRDKETRRQGDKVTRRQGNKGTRRQGNKGTKI